MNARQVADYHAGVQHARAELARATRATSTRRQDPTCLDRYREACDQLRAASTVVVRARALLHAREVVLAEDVVMDGPVPARPSVRENRRARLAEAERAYREAVTKERLAILVVRRTRAALLLLHPALHAVLPPAGR